MKVTKKCNIQIEYAMCLNGCKQFFFYSKSCTQTAIAGQEKKEFHYRHQTRKGNKTSTKNFYHITY